MISIVWNSFGNLIFEIKFPVRTKETEAPKAPFSLFLTFGFFSSDR